jgi:hypothetical protein
MLEIGQKRQHYDLSRHTISEAVTDYVFMELADMAQKRPRFDVFAPGPGSDANGAKLLFSKGVFPCSSAQH